MKTIFLGKTQRHKSEDDQESSLDQLCIQKKKNHKRVLKKRALDRNIRKKK